MKLSLNKFFYYIFLMYFFFLMVVSFWGLKNYQIRLGSYNGISHNLIPFDTISTYIFNFNNYNFNTWFYNTFGVVLLFIPLGILLPVVFKNVKRIRSVIAITIGVSIFIEIMQYLTQLGVFDIDDIILNTIGALFGFVLVKLFSIIIK